MAKQLGKRPVRWRFVLWPAFLSGCVLPGLGQIANREFGKGLLLISVCIGSFFWFSRMLTEQLDLLLPGTPDQWVKNQVVLRSAVQQVVEQNMNVFLTFQILMVLVWGFAVIDAYLTAKQFLKSETPRPDNAGDEDHSVD